MMTNVSSLCPNSQGHMVPRLLPEGQLSSLIGPSLQADQFGKSALRLQHKSEHAQIEKPTNLRLPTRAEGRKCRKREQKERNRESDWSRSMWESPTAHAVPAPLVPCQKYKSPRARTQRSLNGPSLLLSSTLAPAARGSLGIHRRPEHHPIPMPEPR